MKINPARGECPIMLRAVHASLWRVCHWPMGINHERDATTTRPAQRHRHRRQHHAAHHNLSPVRQHRPQADNGHPPLGHNGSFGRPPPEGEAEARPVSSTHSIRIAALGRQAGSGAIGQQTAQQRLGAVPQSRTWSRSASKPDPASKDTCKATSPPPGCCSERVLGSSARRRAGVNLGRTTTGRGSATGSANESHRCAAPPSTRPAA